MPSHITDRLATRMTGMEKDCLDGLQEFFNDPTTRTLADLETHLEAYLGLVFKVEELSE